MLTLFPSVFITKHLRIVVMNFLTHLVLLFLVNIARDIILWYNSMSFIALWTKLGNKKTCSNICICGTKGEMILPRQCINIISETLENQLNSITETVKLYARLKKNTSHMSFELDQNLNVFHETIFSFQISISWKFERLNFWVLFQNEYMRKTMIHKF